MENTDEETFDVIIKEGWINKRSRFLKIWRRRWLVLTPHFLITFKRQQAYLDKPTEKIKIECCSTMKSAEEETKKVFTFRINFLDRVFFFSAQDANDKETWIESIRGAMMPKKTEERCFEGLYDDVLNLK
ncbi:unnamed protein product [Blepharisma stoltei]|uniref:PH domain-containing protein n=1 Tax=Blepharisma stoltei TaxID=1481888 RepID=A0AAU9JTD6_9CILI|nr:unnamed protein product [Blepharisma stoltei]